MLLKRGVPGLLSILLLITTLMPACSNSGKSSDTQAGFLRGTVSASAPVADASLSVIGTDGKTIYKSDGSVTSDSGTFLLDTRIKLPPDFRVTCTPPTSNTELSGAVIIADIRGYDPGKSNVGINLITTLAALYRDKNKGKTLPEAETAVRSFLKIPEYVDVGSPGDTSFSARTFLREATQKGGVKTFIDQLVEQMSQQGAAAHPFAKQGGLMGVGDPGQGVGMYVVDALAKGAINYTAGHLLGWGLSQVGLGSIFGDGKGGVSAQDIADMKNMLLSIQTQMTDLKEKMDSLSIEITESEYRTRLSDLQISLLDVIEGSQIVLYNITTANDSAAKKTDRDALIASIGSKLLDRQTTIHNQLMGDKAAGQKGLIELWSRIVSNPTNRRFLTADDYYLISDWYKYFDNYQQAMVELIAEYYHALDQANGTPGGHTDLVDAAIDLYNTNHKKQGAALPKPVPAGVFVDVKNGNMWFRQPELQTPWGSPIGGNYKSGVVRYVHGDVEHLFMDKSGTLFPPNSGSLLNSYVQLKPGAANTVNYGFNDWVLPTMAQLRDLMSGYTGGNATEEFFKKHGAFPADSTFRSLWGEAGETGGTVWTREWYWNGSLAREVVNVKCIGLGGQEPPAPAIDKEGYLGDAAIFPVRIPSKDELYFYK